ncbi:MAG: hypothetical protein ACRDYD_12225 [Acidimicrobiales bacterium]
MPWCEQCAQFHDKDALGSGGECPACGRVLVARRRVPWHFKLLVLATAIYLGYRIFQGVMWLTHHV